MSPNNLAGRNVDITPFGRISYWTGNDPMTLTRHDSPLLDECRLPVDVPDQGGPHIGVEWEYPRQFSRIAVRFADAEAAPCGSVRLQYWVHNWPPDFSGGWTAVDDPYNGRWVSANGEFRADGGTWTFAFDPLDVTEIDRARDFAVTYRQSYRIRLLFEDGSTPPVAELKVFSDSVRREAALRIEFGLKDDALTYAGPIEVHNGRVISVDDSDPRSVGLRVLYAETRNDGVERSVPTPPDRTIVTVAGFSFLVTDALDGGVYVPDFGVFVGEEGKGGFEAWKASRPTDQPKPIYDRIADEPEQTYERARREIPQLIKTRQDMYGRYVPIGCDANRQEFAVRYNGEIFAIKQELKLVGRDAAKLLWPGSAIWFKFPTGDPPDFREREDGTEQSALRGYLPIYTSEWKDREFVYEMTAFSALLHEPPWEEEKKRGDEPMVALSRVKIRNTTEEKRFARFWMVIEQPEKLDIDDEGFAYAVGRIRDDSVPDSPTQKRWVVDEYPSRRLRAQVRVNGRGEAKAVPCSYAPFEITSIPNAIAYDVELEPRTSHEIELAIPFITFTGDEGRDAVASLDYDAKHAEMVDYWEAQIGAGARISVPEQVVTDFVKATIPHIAITADKDIGSGYYMLPAGTWRYQVCMNEACHQIRSLDYRGHHQRAREYLRPFIELQGTRGLHGRFHSQEGVFHGLRVDDETDYQMFNYNLDHGFVTFALCEHYKFTRDAAWLRSIAPNLVAACDFVTRERRSTMQTDPRGRKVWEYGLIPPGHLEDNPEWHYWYAVNAYCYRGMQAAAEALADIDHPEAERLARDASAYREDIRRSMRRGAELSPVTKLADKTYTPFVPTRAQLRGRDLGWIRDSLYGPAHSVECGVFDPLEDICTWMLRDLEDNVFVSRYRGRQVDLDRFRFSQGGNTIQSGLLPIAMIYLKRDQPEHAVRALFNSLGQNLYEDVRCFTEHPVAAFGLGAGPFYKTPDESCWINWLRNCLLMETPDDGLILAPGMPREWMKDGREVVLQEMATYYGPMSYRMRAERGRITAVIEPPKRNPPAWLQIRFRHPERMPMKTVTVNGQPHPFDGEAVRFENADDLPSRMEIIALY